MKTTRQELIDFANWLMSNADRTDVSISKQVDNYLRHQTCPHCMGVGAVKDGSAYAGKCECCGGAGQIVSLFAFLDLIDCSLEIKRYANQDDRWIAQIENCEIKDGVILSGNYGTGKTPGQAIGDYVQQIKGKHVVVNAVTKYRKEYHVPTNIYFLK